MSAKAKRRSAPVSKPVSKRVEIAEVVALQPRRAGLFVVTVVACDADGRTARVQWASGEQADARLAPALDPAVVQTAIARGEVVIAEEDREGVLLLGTLRTAATPGIEKGDEYVVEARRLKLVGHHEVTLRAGATQVILRAVGMVETIARDITTRAAGVHKLVGRMLHLN